MTFVGAVVAVILSAAAALLVGAGFTELSGGHRWLGVAGVVALCLALPVVLDSRVTRAFRKLDPDARGTHFETLAWVNGAWLLLLLVVFPAFSRTALESHGAWWVIRAADRGSIQAFVSKVAAGIPRSKPAAALAQPAPGPESKALPTPAQKPQPEKLPVTGTVAKDTGRAAIRAPENAGDDDDTPAARVYRDRAASVVVIRTREAVKKDSPLAELFSGLGVDIREGLGSGFVVESDGVVVTNYHVAGTASALDVALQDGRHFTDVTVLRLDEKNDLALLSIPTKGLPVIPLATKEPRVGTRAIAIGSPLGLEYTLTEGIVSALRKSEGTQLLQMQTSIAPGSSGGPLFNNGGELIGVNTATHGANLNMAVHVSHVRALLALPRDPKKLESFERGPEVRTVEAVGGELDPTTRTNVRNAGQLLAHAAQRCAKDLPADASFTTFLTKGFLSLGSRHESNLTDEVSSCLSTSTKLVSLQIGLLISKLRGGGSSVTGVDVTVGGIGASGGELRFRFVQES
jgi:S1-C subfamily serine protease